MAPVARLIFHLDVIKQNEAELAHIDVKILQIIVLNFLVFIVLSNSKMAIFLEREVQF